MRAEAKPSRQLAGQLTIFVMTWVAATAAIFTGVRTQIRQLSYDKLALGSVLLAFALQFALYWLPGFPAVRETLESRFKRFGLPLSLGLLIIAPYIIYCAGNGVTTAFAIVKLIGVTSIVLGVYALRPPDSQALSLQDLTVMSVLAVPVYAGWYRDIWPVPVYLDGMARLFVVSLAAFAVLSVRRLEEVGYVWRIEAGDWWEGAKQLVFFSAIGLPFGFLLRFISWHPRREGIAAVAFSFLGIFLFVAVAEELFFRGMLQNLLERSFANKYLARGVSSVVFGFCHIHHGFPNWRYAIMAAVAGWFYGTAWHNRRSIVAASAVHAAVDTLWRHFLLA